MKIILGTLFIATLIASSPALSYAQTQTIGYGRTTVQLNSSFVQQLTGLGATLTDLQLQPLVNGVTTFRVTEGAIDLRTAAGEVEHAGGYVVTAGTTVIKIQNLTLDTSNAAAPVITALFVVNDSFVGRLQLFTVQPPASLTLPLQLQAGVEQITGFSLSLAPAAANAINGVFGGPVLQAGSALGTADVYTVLEPAVGAAAQ